MIHLASRSPRRRVLLGQIGIRYTVVDAPIDEVRRAGERPERFVERMACEKALAGLAALGDAREAPVLAADTVVVLDGQVLGKPRDAAHAAEMLRVLSGRMHHVVTAVAIVGGTRGETPRFAVSASRVWLREIGNDEIRAYCATGEPLDKAGAYAIQGRAAVFVARLDGSFSGVVGLPLFETAALLREAGVRV